MIWLAVLVFSRQILAAFGGTQEMFDIGVTGLRINFCITPVLGFVMLATTFFQSINRPVPSVLISLLRQVVFLVPFLYLLPLVWQINGIFFAQPISDLLATVLSVVLVWQEQRRMYAKLPAWITTKTPRTWGAGAFCRHIRFFVPLPWRKVPASRCGAWSGSRPGRR